MEEETRAHRVGDLLPVVGQEAVILGSVDTEFALVRRPEDAVEGSLVWSSSDSVAEVNGSLTLRLRSFSAGSQR